MALRWVEGFDALTNINAVPGGGIQRKYESSSGTNLNAQTAVTELPTSLANAASSSNMVLTTNPIVAAPVNTMIVGFAVRMGTNNIADGCGFALSNDDGVQIRLEIEDRTPANPKPGGTAIGFRIMRGATTLATSVQAFNSNNTNQGWLWVEWKVTVDNAAGAFEVRVQPKYETITTTLTWDNPATGVDTQEQVTTGVNRLTIDYSSASSLTMVYDEIYVLDTTGATLNDFVGNLTFERLRVNADGNQTDWTLASATSHIDALDYPVGSLDDTERLTSEMANQISLVNVSDPVLNTSGVAAVIVDHQSRMESATGSLTLAFRYRNANTASEADGGTYGISTTTPMSFTDIRELDPVTGAAWDVAHIPTYEFGVRNLG